MAIPTKKLFELFKEVKNMATIPTWLRGRVIPHNINLEPTRNGGFIASIGCERFAYGPGQHLLMVQELESYLQAPESVEKRFKERHSEDKPQPLCGPHTGVSWTYGNPGGERATVNNSAIHQVTDPAVDFNDPPESA